MLMKGPLKKLSYSPFIYFELSFPYPLLHLMPESSTLRAQPQDPVYCRLL